MPLHAPIVLDQLAAFGALIGIALGIQYGTASSYFVSMIAVIIGALLLAVINPKNRLIPREAVIGIMYALALVACLLLGDKLSGGSAHIAKTLTGSMLWVRWPIVIVTILVYIVLLLFHYRFRRRFIALTEKSSYSAKEKIWDFLFFTTQGVITVLVVPIAGVLLAYAFLMIPAAIALLFTKKWVPGLILGWGLGLIACLIGLMCSYNFDYPYGPSLILSLGLFFVLAIIFRTFLPQKLFIKQERI